MPFPLRLRADVYDARVKAAVWNSAGTLQIADIPHPEPPPGSVLIRPAEVGICGSDLHFYRGEFSPQPGATPGHEIAGYIESSSEGFNAGTAVAVEPTLACGQCASCRRGQVPTCRRLGLMGISAPGGMSELLTAPASNVHALPAGVDVELGALAEPLAVCVRGLNRAEAPVGARVLVLGSGTIGL